MSGDLPLLASLADAPWLTHASSREVVAALSDDGFEVRFVGGCVRDGLLNPTSADSDLDLTTPAKPHEVMAIAKRHDFHAIPTGVKHGTVTVLHQDRRFEITTLREDINTDGRHAKVRFTSDFHADAARRDLTINAMSCAPDGRLFDYFGGYDDLAAGRIRFVGEPALRIAEDYLRILRFFRFYARFGKVPPDNKTMAAITASVDGLERISGERLQKELCGLLLASGASRSLDYVAASGTAQALFGTAGTPQRLKLAPSGYTWIAGLAIWLRGHVAASNICQRLKLSHHDSGRLELLTTSELLALPLSANALRQLIFQQGHDAALDLLRISQALAGGSAGDLEKQCAMTTSTPVPKLPIGGRDLLAMGVLPGPDMGAMLKRVETWWLESGCIKNRDECLAQAGHWLRNKSD